MNQIRDVQLDYVKTGISGLDEILFGGIVRENIVVIEGLPGTGKTNLALDILFQGASKFDEPGLFISFEISPEKVRRDAKALAWDFADLEARNKIKIVHSSPTLMMEQLDGKSDMLSKLIKEVGAKRVVIDGLTPLKISSHRLATRPYRESLLMLLDTLRKLKVTAFLTTEAVGSRPIGEPSSCEEQYLADTILTLRNQARRRSVHRSIEVAKSRGQDYITGRHALKIIANSGIAVFPRVYARPINFTDQPASSKRVPTGNSVLDEMLGGGAFEGSITLVVGISGTGKSVTGMQFLAEGAKSGVNGLYVSLDEHPKQIERNAANLGLDFANSRAAGKIAVLYDTPLEVDLDEHFYLIKAMVEKYDVKRVVIDSVAAYESAQPEEAREFLVALAAYFKLNLIPAFLNFECPELLGVSQISNDLKSSAMVDNIVLLNFVEISTVLRRSITVPKARGSRPAQNTREYVIQAGGIQILDDTSVEGVEKVPQLPLSSYYSILGRAPTRHSPVIDELVANGKPLPKSKTPKAVPRVKRSAGKSKR